MSQARPTTILPDGTPLYPAEWSPQPVDKSGDKPARARFPGGGQGTVGGKPQSRPLHPASQGPRSAVGLGLDQGVEWVGGFPQVPPPRVPESAKQAELPAIQTSQCHGFAGSPRNVTQFGSTSLLTALFERTPEQKKESRKRILQRVRRFRRLRTARKIMHASKMGTCMLFLNNPEAGGDIVLQNAIASYCGVWRCNYRTCPFCGPWLAARDAEKALKLITGWVKRGNAIALCAFTQRHKADESTKTVWNAHTKVLHRLHSGRPWREFAEKYGLLEYIYGNEVTLGDNGSHKHQHRAWEILMCEELKTAAGRRAFGLRMQAEYEALYLVALHAEGRSALPGIALQLSIAAPSVKNAESAADYVSKFAKEISQGGMKSGHKGNRNLWELLDDATDQALSDGQRARARMRFKEVCEGTHGLHWWHASESTTDESAAEGEEEIPEQEEEKGTPVLHFGAEEWRKLVKGKSEGRLLTMVELKGPEYARAWLTRYCDAQRWSKNFGQDKGPAPPPDHYTEWGEEGF